MPDASSLRESRADISTTTQRRFTRVRHIAISENLRFIVQHFHWKTVRRRWQFDI